MAQAQRHSVSQVGGKASLRENMWPCMVARIIRMQARGKHKQLAVRLLTTAANFSRKRHALVEPAEQKKKNERSPARIRGEHRPSRRHRIRHLNKYPTGYPTRRKLERKSI